MWNEILTNLAKLLDITISDFVTDLDDFGFQDVLRNFNFENIGIFSWTNWLFNYGGSSCEIPNRAWRSDLHVVSHFAQWCPMHQIINFYIENSCQVQIVFNICGQKSENQNFTRFFSLFQKLEHFLEIVFVWVIVQPFNWSWKSLISFVLSVMVNESCDIQSPIEIRK